MKLLCLGVVGALIAGCGGSGGSATGGTGGAADGTVTLAIRWPRPAKRVVPLASKSVAVTLTNSAGKTAAAGTIVGPAALWTSPELPPGAYTFQAYAYPTATETGVAQAAGSGSVTVSSNANTTSDVTMASTVASVSVTASTSILLLGSQTQLIATALDASGSTVIVDPSTLTWGSSNPAVATVSSSGLATPAQIGSCSFTATFGEVEPSLGQTPVKSAPLYVTVDGGTTTIGIH